MPDTRYLTHRNGVWQVRFRLAEQLGGGTFQRSLGTPDLRTARQLRDKHFLPFLAEGEALSAIEALAAQIVELREDQSEGIRRLREVLKPSQGQNAPTLADLIASHLDHLRKGQLAPATLQAYESALRGFGLIVGGDRPAEAIAKADVLAYRDELLQRPVNWMRRLSETRPRRAGQTVSIANVAQSLTYVRRFFQWAMDEELVGLARNPVHGVGVPSHRPQHRRSFTQEEAGAACALPFPAGATAFNEEAWQALPRLARYTGARLGELAQLTGKDVLEVQGILCLHIYENLGEGRRTKTHNSRYVPVASAIRPLVEGLVATHGNGPLFPLCGSRTDRAGVTKPGKLFGNAFQRHVKRVAPDLTFHGFRSYAITEMANAGVPEEVRMRIVGHASRAVHQGYTRIDLRVMAEAVERIR